MPRLFTYSGIITKTKGMQANLLSPAQYEELANLSTVSEFITYLRNHREYQKILANSNEHYVHRGELELLLGETMFTDFEKLYLFASGNIRSLLSIFSNRFEIDLLKQLVTHCYTHTQLEQDPSGTHVLTDYFNKFSSLDLSALLQSDSLESLINHLKDSEYSGIFTSLYESNTATIYDYESRLDIYYFTKCWKQAKKLPKKDRKIVMALLGTQIDFQNILWIYRSKRFYELSDNMIFSHIIPIHYKLTDPQLRALVMASGLEDFLTRLGETRYHYLTDNLPKLILERKYISFRTTVLNQIRRKYPMSIAPILYFLYQKELEIDQLTTVLECIRYQIAPNDILKYLNVTQLEESS